MTTNFNRKCMRGTCLRRARPPVAGQPWKYTGRGTFKSMTAKCSRNGLVLTCLRQNRITLGRTAVTKTRSKNDFSSSQGPPGAKIGAAPRRLQEVRSVAVRNTCSSFPVVYGPVRLASESDRAAKVAHWRRARIPMEQRMRILEFSGRFQRSPSPRVFSRLNTREKCLPT